MSESTESRPHVWRPIDGMRHALTASLRDAQPGTKVKTLCGAVVVAKVPAEYDWFWPSCVRCWNVAAEGVGAPKMGPRNANRPNQAPVQQTKSDRKPRPSDPPSRRIAG